MTQKACSNGYDIKQHGSIVTIEGVQQFNPAHIFECGQCFRWVRQADGSHTGIVAGKAVNIRVDGLETGLDMKLARPANAGKGLSIHIKNTDCSEVEAFWLNYLDLKTDYAAIQAELQFDPVLEKPIHFGWGIRLLRQEIWEVLISFILSANNHIPRIMGIVDKISRLFGTRIVQDGHALYAFPTPEQLWNASLEQVNECRAGYRCKYLHQAAGMVAKGEIDLAGLMYMDTASAKKELLKVPGVGPKVADCILLYSGTKMDVFPTDVWVKRVMEELYFHKEITMKELQDFAQGQFGLLAGIAQQYLFYYAREHKIGTGKELGGEG